MRVLTVLGLGPVAKELMASSFPPLVFLLRVWDFILWRRDVFVGSSLVKESEIRVVPSRLHGKRAWLPVG